MMVIRHAEPKSPNAGVLQHSAETNLSIPLTIPLREHDKSKVFAGFEESSVDRIVRPVRSLDVTGESQEVPVEVILSLWVRRQ